MFFGWPSLRTYLQVTSTLQREFFSLVAVWLACRFQLIHATTNEERMWRFLGEMDYHAELQLLVQEASITKV